MDVCYLPFRAKRSSACLGRVEKCRIFFWLIVLREGRGNVERMNESVCYM